MEYCSYVAIWDALVRLKDECVNCCRKQDDGSKQTSPHKGVTVNQQQQNYNICNCYNAGDNNDGGNNADIQGGNNTPPPAENNKQPIPPRNPTETVKVGLWGNITDGDTFEHTGFDGIQFISIYYSDSGIHSIEVHYTKQGKVTRRREGDKKFPREPKEIKLEGGNFIKKVSGCYRPYGDDRKIRSLTFTTNGSDEPEGPYGANHEENGVEQFSVGGGKIVGFYGNADEKYVYAIGFYVLPLNADDFITVGPWGRKKSKHFPALHKKAGIETLTISHNAVIDSIRVKYRNEDSPHTLGGVGGTPDKEIRFKDGEYINKVIGYYGRYKDPKLRDFETINKLIFTTNRQERPLKYGNDENWDDKTKATEFSVEGGRIVGFHGTGETYVSSIGFYILPKDRIN